MSLIVLDGLDGSGKSTQLTRLDAYFRGNGTHYRQISFPDYEQPSSALVKQYLGGEFGGSPAAVNAYAASSFYAVDRYASYKKFWQRDYEEGTLILAARYTTSNAIHQMGKLPREEWDAYLTWLEHYEYDLLGLPRPDRVLFLDMPLEVSQKLLVGRYEGDAAKRDIHERDMRYLTTCRASALYAAERLGWSVIPCAENGEPLSVESITARLIESL
ncbi:MAG: thymidylate kinase [Clostridia bacterium]|nr:thymidylate kinase [Clostridia bacterium]